MKIVRRVCLVCTLVAAVLFPGRSAFSLSDVTDSFQVERDRPYYDYTRGQTYTTVSLTNSSSEHFQGRLRLVIDNVTSVQVSVYSPDGFMENGEPYFDLFLPWQDLDGDGTVDGNDLAMLTNDLGRSDCNSDIPCDGDLDWDGDVDGADLAFYNAELGQSDDTLAPEETYSFIPLRFDNPGQLRFDFTVKVFIETAGCTEGATRHCETVCGAGRETCVNGAWVDCNAPMPESEICDGIDNDCDGVIDEGLTSPFFADSDNDGFGDPTTQTVACTAPAGYVLNNQDCNDKDPRIHPGATEIPDNCVDEDCDGIDLISQHGDAWLVDCETFPGGDGLSWASAFNTIQAAVLAASEEDEIWVKAGTCHLTDTISIDKAIHIFGGFAGSESSRGQRDCQNETVISGEFFKGVGLRISADATLSGLTMTAFWSGIHCVSPFERQGGAIIIEDASPTISNSVFVQNRGLFAGAIYVESTSPGIEISPEINRCTFADNSSLEGGGAIYNRYCSPRISGCRFTGNTGNGAAVMENYGSSPTISECIFEGNHPFSPIGPVMLSHHDSSPEIIRSEFSCNQGHVVLIGGSPEELVIDDCMFRGNNSVAVAVGTGTWNYNDFLPPVISNSRFMANHGRSPYEHPGSPVSAITAAAAITGCLFERNHSAGAVYVEGSRVDVINSIFRSNTSGGYGSALGIRDDSQVNVVNSLFTGNIVNCSYNRTCGGAISNEQSNPVIINSTFSGNRTQFRLGEYILDGGAINNYYESMPIVVNSIFWDNGPRDIWNYWANGPGAAVTHSMIGFYDPSLELEENLNVDADPVFADMMGGDYRLGAVSPAIDAGTFSVPDPPGLPVGDLGGDSRILDGDGNGSAEPDMGAYEYVPGTNTGEPPGAPLNVPPVAKADAKMDEEHNVKDYTEFQEHRVGDTIQLDGTGSWDRDEDALTYQWSFVHVPTRSVAVLSDPTDAQPTFIIDANGVYALRLVVNDGRLDSEPDFLVIYTQNRLPVISAAPDITANVGEPVELSTAQIHDPDGDPLTYQWCFSPGWPNYEFDGKPANSSVTLDGLRGPNPTFIPDVPGVYSFIVKPFDGYSYGRQCNYPRFFSDHIRCDYVRIYAQESANVSPKITSTPSSTATVGLSYVYEITFEDPDDTSVMFTLDVAPSGMYVDRSSHVPRVVWKPTADQLGRHDVVIRVVDVRGSYSLQPFSITVSNDSPVIVSRPVPVATERVLYRYQVEATDPNTTYLMRFFLDEGPQGMSIHSATGLIEWTPTSSQLGEHLVTVRVEDIAGFPDTQTFTIRVKENAPPMFVSTPPTATTEGVLYVYRVNALDEGEGLVYSLGTAPADMTIDSSSGLVNWTPSSADVGSHDVVVEVTDTMGLSASQEYSLQVHATEAVDGDGDSYAINDGDCDDSDPAIYPGAFDRAGNDIDEDCDGADALTSIRITTGKATISVLPDMKSHIGHILSFRSTDTTEYHIQFTQTVSPDDGTLTLNAGFPSEVSTTGSKSWLVGTNVTGSAVGSYELNTLVTVVETGQTDQVTTTVNVGGGEEGPVVHPLGSYPDAIPIGEMTEVRFTFILTGTRVQPAEVVLEEVNDAGVTIRTLGALVDNGSSGDLQAGDYVYSGVFDVHSDAEGMLRFRARAVFSGLAQPVYSETCKLHVTRFPTDINSHPPSAIAQDSYTGAVFVTDRILVTFVEGTDADTIAAIVSAVDGQVIGTILSLGIFQVSIPDTYDETGVKTAMDGLYQYSEVRSIEPVFLGFVAGVDPDDTHYVNGEQEYLRHIRADEAWVVSRGGPLIAVVDSGVDYTHPDLREKVIRGRNYVSPYMMGSPNWDPWNPMDDYGHGTRVAGLAGAISNNGIGMAGVAWDSKILAVRAGSRRGVGGRDRPFMLYDAAVSAIRYAVQEGAKIINVSEGFSEDYFDRPLDHPLYDYDVAIKRVIDLASQKGCLVVAAAGNENSSSVGYPGVFDPVLCVGAVEVDPDTGAVTRWNETIGKSNHGPDVDIAAPGRRIYSTTLNGSYTHDSGTSFAAPMVSGAAALVWSNHPDWTAQQVREQLEATAIPLRSGEKELGAGMVDLFEAVFNGSFETGDLQGWRAGLTPSYIVGVANAQVVGRSFAIPPPMADYYFPTPRGDINNWMAYVDNSGTDVSGATLSQSFYVQPGVQSTAFSFEGYFVTDEFPEWFDQYGCYEDFIEVTVLGPSYSSPYPYYKGDYLSNSYYGEYYYGTDFDIGEPGLVQRPYDANHPECWERENNYVGSRRFFESSGEIVFHDGPGNYTIEISVWDAPPDDVGDTAILIDNIRFR